MHKIFVLILFLSLNYSNGEFYTRHDYIMEQFRKSAETLDLSSVETKWIKQPVDHFNQTDTRNWRMLYYQNMEKSLPENPVYIFIGGEGPLGPCCLKSGLLYELAEETKGAMFATEHRYYGETKPLDPGTRANLRYLSSRQALADIATLITQIKQSPSFSVSKVVVVGGSYAGNLATWMRLLYPDLVDAAIASSAPVLAKMDCFEYFETVGDDFQKYTTPNCLTEIILMCDKFKESFKSEDGIKQLKYEYNICESSDLTKKDNRAIFYLEIINLYAQTAQYGSPAKIRDFCDSHCIENHDLSQHSCNDLEFEHIYNSNMGNMWYYQTCTEFGYFLTMHNNKLFADITIDTDFWIRICSASFGPEFTAETIENNIKTTNNLYGGLSPNVTNVIFTHGEIDPWHTLGILKDLSERAPVRVIPGASHCNDLYSDAYTTDEVRKVKREEKRFIKKCIGL